MRRVGIALGADRLVAVLPSGQRLETAGIADLRLALEDLKKTAALQAARVSVALLPPLVELRRVSLPPLRSDERRRVIARDAGRFFLGARDAQIVGSDPPFAAAASAQLVEAIESATAAIGWTLDAVVPAHIAWARSVRDGQLIAGLPEGTELIRAERGVLVERSRVRAVDSPAGATEIEPFTVAAKQAARIREGPLELLSAARRAARERAAHRFAWSLSAAALACVLAAAGLDYWGINRELDTLRARRTAIASELAGVMRTHDSLTTVSNTVATLVTLEEGAPTWSGFFADLADYLPRDAHLDAFRAVGDSVAMVGVAHEAAAVFQGLERMPRLSALRADGAIRQDVTAAGVVREHFGLSARWSSP